MIIRRIVEAQGDLPEKVKRRLARVESLFAVDVFSAAASIGCELVQLQYELVQLQ